MFYLLLAAFALFVLVLLVRTAVFTPPKAARNAPAAVEFDRERSLSHLAKLIACPTVSHADPALDDGEAFAAFPRLLQGCYPRVFAACEEIPVADRAILLRWPGQQAGDPAVCMAHYDVVPADPTGWRYPPFSGQLAEDKLWGRGTLDTKGTLHSALFAAETLLEQGFTPKQDVYFAFSGSEEVSGPGAEQIVNWFAARGITPGLVLDEGGAVVEGVFPGVKAPCALVGIGEKGFLNARFTARSTGGHASAPSPNAPIDRLAKAAVRILKNPFPMHLSSPAAQMFDRLGRHSGFFYRLVFANLWCFAPVLDLLSKASGGEMNALLRTTLAFTQMSGSSAPNVIPPQAELVANLRLNPADSVSAALARLQALAGEGVKVEAISACEPSAVSSTKTAGYETLCRAISAVWPEAIVSPYLMIQCADARHWSAVSDRVYRFSAMDLTADERRTIHGQNEAVRTECLHRAVSFYLHLLKAL